MSEFGSEKQTNPETNSETTVQRSEQHPKRHGRNLVMWLAGTALLAAGAFAVQAVAQSETYEQFRMSAGHMGGWPGEPGPGGWHPGVGDELEHQQRRPSGPAGRGGRPGAM